MNDADEEMIERAGSVLIDAASGPAKVILLGSHAGGGNGFDFLVIEQEVEDQTTETAKLRHALTGLEVPVKVLVMDAAAAEQRAKMRGTMVDRALREGRIVAES